MKHILMSWVLLLAGNGSHLSLQLVQSSKAGSLVMSKPWLTHGNPCLFSSLWNSFRLEVMACK